VLAPAVDCDPGADVAQLAEHRSRKAGVEGSSPSVGSFIALDSADSWSPLNLTAFFQERDPADSSQGAHQVCPVVGSTDNCTRVTSLGTASDGFTTVGLPNSDGMLDINNAVRCPGPECQDDTYWSPEVLSGSCAPLTMAGVQTNFKECGDAGHAAMYYNLTTTSFADGQPYTRSYWDYWLFYRYDINNGPSTGNHEGDWEGLVVVTTAGDPYLYGDRILYVNYAQHGEAFRALPGTFGTADGHPTDYVAADTHASYPDYCASDCLNNRDQSTEYSHRGDVTSWAGNSDCAACVVAIPEQDSSPGTLPTQSNAAGWAAVPIQWGSTVEQFFPPVTANSDTGPAFNSSNRYVHPWQVNGGDPLPAAATISGAGPTVGNEADCGSWFGGDVVALLCDHGLALEGVHGGVFGLARGGFGISAPNHRSGQTLGIAQMVGPALRDGQELDLTGAIPRSLPLKLVVRLDSDHVAYADFTLPPLVKGAATTISASSSTSGATVSLTLHGGRRIRASSVVVKTIPEHPRTG
jgi:hypothetical protein